MWDGYLTFGGTEILNAPRVTAYLRDAMPHLKIADPCVGDCSCEHLHKMLDEKEYASPIVDDAPWIDIDRPESFQFFGAYPLNIQGIDDDPTEALTVSGHGDGGWVTARRRGVKEVLVEAALFSANDEADHYGISWLKAALDGGCDVGCRPQDRLCFLTACVDPYGFDSFAKAHEFTVDEFATLEGHNVRWDRSQLWLDTADAWVRLDASPMCSEVDWEIVVDGVEDQIIRFTRGDATYEDLALTGFAQTVRLRTDDEFLTVSVVDDAGLGYPVKVWFNRLKVYGRVEATFEDCTYEFYRNLRRVARTEGPTTLRVDHLHGGGVIRTVRFVFTAEVPYIFSESRSVAEITPDEVTTLPDYTAYRMTYNLPDCTIPRVPVITDPDMPLQPPKPPPSLAASRPVNTTPGERPYAVVIPDTAVNTWTSTTPTIFITATQSDLRDVRVRFFPMMFNHTQPQDIDVCSQCGAFEIGYIPKGYTMRVCACSMSAYLGASEEEQDILADHLLHGDRQLGRFEWPVLSCGTGYLMVVDTRDRAAKIELRLAVRE